MLWKSPAAIHLRAISFTGGAHLCTEAFFYLMTPRARRSDYHHYLHRHFYSPLLRASTQRARGTSALSEQLIFKGAAAAGRKRNYFCCCLALSCWIVPSTITRYKCNPSRSRPLCSTMYKFMSVNKHAPPPQVITFAAIALQPLLFALSFVRNHNMHGAAWFCSIQ